MANLAGDIVMALDDFNIAKACAYPKMAPLLAISKNPNPVVRVFVRDTEANSLAAFVRQFKTIVRVV